MIDLRHLRTIHALRETESLQEAAERLRQKGLQAKLFAAVRSDMLEVPYLSDFLLTAKDTSFSTLEGVNAVLDAKM